MRLCIANAKILTPFEEKTGWVLVEDGKITAIESAGEIPADAVKVDAKGSWLCPGFVDIHVHGGGGREAMEGKADAILAMANAHALHGTTTILPTTLCASLVQTEQAVDAVKSAMKSPDRLASIAGVHLEGPYLNPAQAGAQKPDRILTPAKHDWRWILQYDDVVRMAGIAPELDGAYEMAEALAERGVTVTAAHTDAEYGCMEEALNHGFSDITHLYSACSTVKRVKGFRVGGAVEAGLTLDGFTVQIIADGCHLPPELIRLIYRCKCADRIELITDALCFAASGLEDGSVVTDSVGTQMIYKDGVMKLMDEKAFAGSVATTDRLIHTVCAAGIPLRDAVRMATDTPARRIGLTNKGRIAPGCDADLLLMNENLQVEWIMANGRIIRDDLNSLGKG